MTGAPRQDKTVRTVSTVDELRAIDEHGDAGSQAVADALGQPEEIVRKWIMRRITGSGALVHRELVMRDGVSVLTARLTARGRQVLEDQAAGDSERT